MPGHRAAMEVQPNDWGAWHLAAGCSTAALDLLTRLLLAPHCPLNSSSTRSVLGARRASWYRRGPRRGSRMRPCAQPRASDRSDGARACECERCGLSPPTPAVARSAKNYTCTVALLACVLVLLTCTAVRVRYRGMIDLLLKYGSRYTSYRYAVGALNFLHTLARAACAAQRARANEG